MDADVIAERAQRMREAISGASVEHSSDDLAVTVVAGPSGAVLDLRLSSRAFRYEGAELSALVVRTIRAANARLDVELAARIAEITGSGPAPFAPLPTPARLRADLDRENDR